MLPSEIGERGERRAEVATVTRQQWSGNANVRTNSKPMRGSVSASWKAVATVTSAWAAVRQPRATDVPLTLYRDANSWCPFCHRGFFFLEQKGLRYTTERIHLGGDPREPPKAASYLRNVAPRGNVPGLP